MHTGTVALIVTLMPATVLATSERAPVEPARSKVTQKLVFADEVTFSDGPRQLSVPKKLPIPKNSKKQDRATKKPKQPHDDVYFVK